MTQPESPDLVVLSHLRWVWVWQRPQHLVSRFAALRQERGARAFFVEEPVVAEVSEPTVRSEETSGITRVWLELPSGQQHPGFDSLGAERYGELLQRFFEENHRPTSPDVLLYTPLALDAARSLSPRLLAYDVMDDLASFANAPIGLKLAQRRTLAAAEVVFAGGRTLHRSISGQYRGTVHLFPSGVETEHYATSRLLRQSGARTGGVAGYVGVIDERLDLDLIGALAAELPDWTIRIVGPVAKIDPHSLPEAPNIEYPGMANYEQLPAIMADFDVALMPFALNEATRSISPTKTLEYLAAGLPVVSTRVPDVVTDYADIVQLADTATGFADACAMAVRQSSEERDRRAQPIQSRHNWDVIASAMVKIMDEAVESTSAVAAQNTESAPSWGRVLETAHRNAAAAAAAGLQDPALADIRLSGTDVGQLAEAAVSSATPFLRAPLLARVSAALLLHPLAGNSSGWCETCDQPAPCATAKALKP